MEEYVKSRSGPLSTVNGSSALLQQIGGSIDGLHAPSNERLSPSLASQYELLLRDLETEAVAQEISITGGISWQYFNDSSKVFSCPGDGNYYSLLGILQHPFSRGSVHIQSAEPTMQARLDPCYLSHPLGLQLTKQIALHMQTLVTTKPLSDLLQGNGTVFQPGYHKLTPDNVDDFIRETLLIAYHHSGNCAMLPEEKGGVVDERFRVYGVKGLRVVDASVFPLIPQATITSLVIAIAERAADIITEDTYI
jgi:choline dehydrogenase